MLTLERPFRQNY